MFRILFFIIALSSVAFAQTQDKKEPVKFFEYEKISGKLLTEKLESLCAEADKISFIGWVIYYGDAKGNKRREEQLKKSYSDAFDACHDSRITFVDGGEKGGARTEFWIVAPGEKPPQQ